MDEVNTSDSQHTPWETEAITQPSHPVSDSDDAGVHSDASTPEEPESPRDGTGTPPEIKEHQFTRFECGAKFQVVDNLSTENGALCLEDVQKSSRELWLIKAPHNFDFEGLSDQQVLLNAQQILKTASSHGSKRHDVVASKMSQPHHQVSATHILLPSRNSKKLAPGPPFKGQITITESMAIPAVTLPSSPPSKTHELPPGLKQRYVPFGWAEPIILPDSPPHSPAKSTDDTDSSPKKKKKKADREKKTSKTEEETGVHDHRKRHKRKIKTEVPDSDEAPASTKKKKKKKHKANK